MIDGRLLTKPLISAQLPRQLRPAENGLFKGLALILTASAVS
jgi:hypothetical protein